MRSAHFTQTSSALPTQLGVAARSGAVALKIALIIPPFAGMRCADSTEGNDGICAIVSQLSRELARRGHLVHVYGPGNSCIDRESYQLGVRLKSTVSVAYADDPALVDRGYPFVDDATYTRYAQRVVVRLRRAQWYDVIHCHDTRMIPFLEAAGFRHAIATLHTCIHDIGENTPDRDICAQYPLFPIIPITSQQTDPLRDRIWLAAVNNGIDTDRYNPKPRAHNDGRINIGTIGRCCGNKGFELSARVAIELQRRGLPVRLTMVGGTSLGSASYYETRIKPLIAANPDTIVAPRPLGFEAVNRFYEDSDVLLLPYGCEPGFQGWHEPSGNTNMEAMLKARPVVTGNKASSTELFINNVTGVCVDLVSGTDSVAWDTLVTRFADGVIQALRSPNMGAQARKHAMRRFSVTRMTDGYLQHYQFVAAKRLQLVA